MISLKDFYKLAGLDENGEPIKGDFSKATKNDHPIKKTFHSAIGRKIVVVKRQNDFAVGAGYDDTTGYWEQGYYGFDCLEAAENFIIKELLV